MEESMEKLLKELLQKKLHGSLTAEEELILSDLVERKRSGGFSPTPSTPQVDMSAFGNLMKDTDALMGSLDEMAGKVRQRSGHAEAKDELAEEVRKSKEKK